MDGGIYSITNNKNTKRYIGSTTKFYSRWGNHKYELRNNRHKNPRLQNAWNKYKEENFEFKILERVLNENWLLEIEQYYLDVFEPEYNINKIAGPALHGQNNPMYGKHHSNETKEKIRVANKGRLAGRKHHLYGKTHSIEAKIKISKANKGKIISDKQKEKISIANRGKIRSEESKRKYSLSKLGRLHPRWKGQWITPFGLFDTLKQASNFLKMGPVTLAKFCKTQNRGVLTIKSIARNRCLLNLKANPGQTPKELGFGFEPHIDNG